MSSTLVAFSFWYLPSGFVWAFLAVLNFWVWRRSKSSGHLVMLLGAAWLAQYYVLATFDFCLFGLSNCGLAVLLGSLLFAVGFYLSVKPLVADDFARARRWILTKFGKSAVASAPGEAAPSTARPPPTQFFSPTAGATPLPPPVPFSPGAAQGNPPQEPLNLR